MAQDRQTLLPVLGETDARIEEDLPPLDTRPLGSRHRRLELASHLTGQVVVGCPVLHRADLAAAVHQQQRTPGGRYGLGQRRVRQAADIVDQVGPARAERRGGYFTLAGVDRDRPPGRRPQRLENRHQSRQLLVCLDRSCTAGVLRTPGASRLAAEVQEIGAGLEHREPVRHSALWIEPQAAIAERVGSDVQDSHHQRSPADRQRSLAGQAQNPTRL